MKKLKAKSMQDVKSFAFMSIMVGCMLWWFVSGNGMAFFVALGAAFAAFVFSAVAHGARSAMLARTGESVVSAPVEPLPLGAHFVVTYRQSWKRAVDVRRVVTRLVLRETVRYTSGSTTQTDTHDDVVHCLETQGRRFELDEVFSDEYSFRIPLDGMHTFAPSENNRIEWYVTLDVELAGRPDMHRECEITVLPRFGG